MNKLKLNLFSPLLCSVLATACVGVEADYAGDGTVTDGLVAKPGGKGFAAPKPDLGSTLKRPIIDDFVGLKQSAKNEGVVRVIVHLHQSESPKTVGQLQTKFLKSHRIPSAKATRLTSAPVLALNVDNAQLLSMSRSPLIESIRRDIMVTPQSSSQNFQNRNQIGADRTSLRNVGLNDIDRDAGKGTAIAILDTGFDTDHPDFADRIKEERCFSTSSAELGVSSLCPNGDGFYQSGPDTQRGPGAAEACDGIGACFHGTHVAGIASSIAPAADLILINVFSQVNNERACGGPAHTPCLRAFSSDIIRGLEYVRDVAAKKHRVASVNMSLGSGLFADQDDCDSRWPLETAVIGDLRNMNIATVASAGNDGQSDRVGYPACLSTAVSVGSVYAKTNYEGLPPFEFCDGREANELLDNVFPGNEDKISDFSNHSTFVDLLAPGERILSSQLGGGHCEANGTSMAAPHVAGAWALLKAKRPFASVHRVLSVLRVTGKPISEVVGKSGWNSAYPFASRIQVDQAFAAIDKRKDFILEDTFEGSPGGRFENLLTWYNIGSRPAKWEGVLEFRRHYGESAEKYQLSRRKFKNGRFTVRFQRATPTNRGLTRPSDIVIRSTGRNAINQSGKSEIHLKITPAGSFSVIKYEAYGHSFLAPWQEHSAINRYDEWNQVEVQAKGSEIIILINKEEVWRGVDPNPVSGHFGFGLGQFPVSSWLRVDYSLLETI